MKIGIFLRYLPLINQVFIRELFSSFLSLFIFCNAHLRLVTNFVEDILVYCFISLVSLECF